MNESKEKRGISHLSLSEVKSIAKLARLEVNDTEAEAIARDLSNILTYVKKLDELDTSEVSPLSHVHGAKHKFREDIVEDFQDKSAILENIPERSGNFIKVPLIIDQESH